MEKLDTQDACLLDLSVQQGPHDLAQSLHVLRDLELGAGQEDAAERAGVEGEPDTAPEVASSTEQEDASLETTVIVEKAVAKAAAGDCGAPFEELALRSLLAVKTRNTAEWMRVRERLKSANKAISLVQLDKALAQLARDLKPVAPTHHGYAKDVLARLTVEGHKPVAVHGTLYVPSALSQLWEERSLGELQGEIAEAHDGKENCTRHEDYFSIATFAVAMSECPDFFETAPQGVACLRSFYSVCDGKIRKERLGLSHRQVHALPFEPAELPTPLYDQFRRETFHSAHAGEEAEQVALIDEFAGATMVGIAYKYQKAMVWTEPFGRAGKGTLQRILGNLVPEQLRCAVSPMHWGAKEYYLATLAEKRLNVVGELPENATIPAAEFKSVLGLDAITGRWPTKPPFTFENRAAHLFMSNHAIKTNEHSEAFFTRWLLVEFPNSLLVSGKKVDPTLADRILQQELPGIAFKALQGAARLLEQGGYSESKAHGRLMADWRRSASPLQEFIHECCDLGEQQVVKRSAFYQEYVQWCKSNGRLPSSKARVKAALSHTLGLGTRLSVLNGHEVFRGVGFKEGMGPDPALSFDHSDLAEAAGQGESSQTSPDF